MVLELLDEVPDLIPRIRELEQVLRDEIEAIETGRFEILAEIAADKEHFLPALQRANSIIRAILAEPPGYDLAQDPDLQDLSYAMLDLNETAQQNEAVVRAAIKATEYTVRSVLRALRQDQEGAFRLYTRSGAPTRESLRVNALSKRET